MLSFFKTKGSVIVEFYKIFIYKSKIRFEKRLSIIRGPSSYSFHPKIYIDGSERERGNENQLREGNQGNNSKTAQISARECVPAKGRSNKEGIISLRGITHTRNRKL